MKTKDAAEILLAYAGDYGAPREVVNAIEAIAPTLKRLTLDSGSEQTNPKQDTQHE